MHLLSSPRRVLAGMLWAVLLLPAPTRANPFAHSVARVAESLYYSLPFQDKPDVDLLRRALSGYYQLKEQNRLSDKQIITIVDFRKASSERRLWVIDLANQKVRYYTLVAHGRNSGELFATRFSNRANSHQSSLGFYITGDMYYGKHGLSLKLYGAEKGINDQAEARAIVMHGADYVSESFVEKNGRLGRSFGCPAIPYRIHRKLIGDVAGGTCLFIYYPDGNYLRTSSLGNPSLPIVSK
ncbi:MAG TPA: murein L,D-transpeptidase catalytic domain family protein [Cyclobacteriaceae bacterium]